MKIRKIKKSDLFDCYNILRAAYALEPHNEKINKDVAKKYIDNKYNYCKKNSFVLTEENEIIGFIFINISSWSNGPQAIIEEIVISPKYQNKGLGKKLLEYTDKHFKKNKVKSIMIWNKKSPKLINFYQKQGFFLDNNFIVMFKDFK